MPVEGLVEEASRVRLTDFSRKCLGAFGFASLAERLEAGELPGLDDIQLLLEKAPVSVLLKLIELVDPQPSDASSRTPDVLPIGYIPLHELLQKGPEFAWEEVSRYLEAFPYQAGKVCVALDDYQDIEKRYGSILGRWISRFPHLAPVAPSLESMIQYLMVQGEQSNHHRVYMLERILGGLGQIGFSDSRGCAYRGGVKMLRSAGFEVSLITGVDRYRRPHQLARELHKIQQMTAQDALITRWSPGLVSADGDRGPGASFDFYVLRVLLVGALALRTVPHRWVNSRFLRTETLEFMGRTCVNDSIWASIDEESAKKLNIHTVETLSSFLPLEASCVHG